MTRYLTQIDSPVGPLTLVSDGRALTGLYMADQRHAPPEFEGAVRDDGAAPFAEARAQLAAYFEGRLWEFDLPLAPEGTPFRLRVWESLRAIPYGETISYGELARRVGNANASRAVGLANGRNPIGIVVPCHRVIGANGSLTGYGGGLERKAALLALERGMGRDGR
jgi:methylated-DNA-[protein]-cysteine S-methyltransferase